MNRAAFLIPAVVLAASGPARATGRKNDMVLDELLSGLHARCAHATTLTVRHVGPLVSMLTELTVAKLAETKPIATTHERHDLEATLDAISAAEPHATLATSEQRWHVTFSGADGSSLLVVTSSIHAPRHGTIAGRRVLFTNDRLVHYLKATFAPNELG